MGSRLFPSSGSSMKSDLSPMMAQYREVRDRYPGYILLFRVGDFYETFGEDAKGLAKELDIVLTSRQGDGSGQRIPLAGVPAHAIESYLARLVRKGHGVVLCDQVEDPKKAKGLIRREVTRVVTPGTVLEETLLPGGRSNYLAAWGSGPRNDRAATLVDISTGETLLKLGLGGDEIAFANEVLSFNPSELLVALGARLDPGVLSLLGGRRIVPGQTPMPIEDLPAQWREAARSSAGAAIALGLAASYVKTCEPRIFPHLAAPILRRPGERMVLDAKTLRHLEVTEAMGVEPARGPTLLGILDVACTAPGHRTLEAWVRSPLAEVAAIERRLEIVEAFHRDGEIRNALRAQLRGVADLARISGRIRARRVLPREVLALGRSIAVVNELGGRLAAWSSAPASLHPIATPLSHGSSLGARILRAIQEEPPAIVADGGVLRPEAFPGLAELRRRETSARERLHELEKREGEATGIRNLRIGYTQAYGFYFEVTRPNVSRVPHDRWTRKHTLTGSERYTSEELTRLEGEVLQIGASAQEEESRQWEGLLAEVETQGAELQEIGDAVGALDALLSLAHVARERGWTRPKLSEGSGLRIREGRHPVLEGLLGPGFVPNDSDLDTEASRLLLLTGPNMAGKSTYMRQVGLIVLLAQCGSFVPARYAEIGIVSHLATRMGFTDEIGRGKSSFMVEMTEVAEILASANRRSLILLDEVGRGTSTSDGLAIAWALVKHLHDRLGARTIVATHYHQLARLVEPLPHANNAHLAVKEEKGGITFLRTLVPGATDKSYGIHVAELAGLPESVTKEARRTLQAMESGNSPGPDEAAAHRRSPPTQRYTQGILLQDPEGEEAKRLLEELRSIETETITPLEALNLLHELSRKLKAASGETPQGPSAAGKA